LNKLSQGGFLMARIHQVSGRVFAGRLRAAGIETGGPAAFSQADRQAFANQLDRFLAKIPG